MRNTKRGTVLVVTLGILTIMSIMGSSFALLMRTEREATENYKLAVKAKLLARDGVIDAGARLQTLMTFSYYSSLYNDDPNMPDELRNWAYGVQPNEGRYAEDPTNQGEYLYLGGTSITHNLAPVCLPYPNVDTNAKKAFIDHDGDGVYTQDVDTYLDEIDPNFDKAVFYHPIEERALFSGLPADGHYLGGGGITGGTYFRGGDRYKLKVIAANSQLSVNYLGSTLYDFLVDSGNHDADCPGSQFKYMLFYLGNGIKTVLKNRIEAETGAPAVNPFDKNVVDELYELKMSFGSYYDLQQFSSKSQIRGIVEQYHPGYWKYVEDFITISAWPAYNPIYAKYNPNTIIPNINNADDYKEKIGEYVDTNPLVDSKVGDPSRLKVIEAVQPPIDANIASLPVLYAASANLSGDARFYYFSPDVTSGSASESIKGDIPTQRPFIDELDRAYRLWKGNERTHITADPPGAPDSKTFYLVNTSGINTSEKEIKQFPTFEISHQDYPPSGNSLFKRNFHVLHHINLSPFKTDPDGPGGYGGSGTDYAWNLALAIESLRPFTSWADFDKRVIQDIIIKNSGEYLHPTKGNIRVCERFRDFWHPWNKFAPGGGYGDSDINPDYFEQWYYEAVADLLRANFNPTPKITKFNPDAAYYQKIDRADLVYWTVPFIFNLTGIFEVTSVGEIIGQVFDPTLRDYVPKSIVQKQYQAVIKVSDIVRHHTQRDFVTGFPDHPGAFGGEDDYSVVRLYAHRNPSLRRYSLATTYPQPINEDVIQSRIKDHKRPNRGSSPVPSELVYNTGWFTGTGHQPSGGIELLYGNNVASESIKMGYVTVRPQDTGPFDYEMRTDMSSGAYLGSPNGITTNQFTPSMTVGPAALEIASDNQNTTGPHNAYLNFWMPFNETFDTISKRQGSNLYGWVTSGGNSFQSARIGSAGNNARLASSTMTSGLVWNASGFIFRSWEFRGRDEEFPTYLEYPAGVGFFVNTGEHDLMQQASGDPITSNAVGSASIISKAPHIDINKQVTDGTYSDSDDVQAISGSEGFHKQHQWIRQKQTNFPYYQGTVEFWFKSDVDQWDMAADGYDSDTDTFYGGFVSANVLVQFDTTSGIQGCQTFIVREMYNTFYVTRVYFVDAIKGTVGGSEMSHWVVDKSGRGFSLSHYIYHKGDTVPDLLGHTDPKETPQLDPDDLGFVFARFDSWFQLKDINNEFKWRPHEWYHLAFSFKSNHEVATNPGEAINFFINGVYVDRGLTNYPTSRMSTQDTTWNTGAKLIGSNPNNPDMTEYVQKMGSIINEVIPENNSSARLVIGAVKRNQATKEQLEWWNQRAAAAGHSIELTREMFYFADGPFVAPANGTMDAVRITGKYLNSGDLDFSSGTRIRAFARYNTSPGDPVPDLLASYENGFPNIWERDVRIASITWNEYRPKWDSADSVELLFDDAPYCRLEFNTFKSRTADVSNSTERHNGVGYTGCDSGIDQPLFAKEGLAPSGSGIGIVDAGIAFPGTFPPPVGVDDPRKLMIPAHGCFIYRVYFHPNRISAVNAVSIFDELTVTVLTPIEVFSFEEIIS